MLGMGQICDVVAAPLMILVGEADAQRVRRDIDLRETAY
jgi:hypothetical protein